MAHNNNHHNNPGGGNGDGGTSAGASGGAAQPANGLPSWLTSGNGGTGAPIPISAWLSPNYPGGYAGWLNDHPDPGHSSTPPSNPVYKEWLQQQVGSDGQLHLPPAASVGGAAVPAPSGSSSGGVSVSSAVAAPTYHNPAANVPQVSEAVPANPNPVTGAGPGAPDYPDNSPTPPNHIPVAGGGVVQNATLTESNNNGSANGGGTSASASSASNNNNNPTYAVRRGDTLSSIAAEHGISLSRLEALNPQIKNPNLIHAGETIHLGGSDLAAGGSSGGTAAPTHDGSVISITHGNNGAGGTVAVNHGFHDSGHAPDGTGGISAPSNTNTPQGGLAAPSSPSSNTALADPAAHPQEGIQHSKSIGKGGKLIDPAARPRANGSVVAADFGFPTSSTYPPSDNARQTAFSKIKNKVKGWGNSGTAVDPAQKAISVADSRDTNPLHIKDKGNSSRA